MTAQRGYFPSSGTPACTPAFGSIWEDTNDAVRYPLYQHRVDTANQNKGVTETSASVQDGLISQFISDDYFAAGEVPQVNWKIAVRMYETDATADCYLQAMLRVVSNDGLVEREVIYSGQTATSTSANSADPNYELNLLSQAERILTGTVPPGLIVQEGDRLVVEIGVRFCNSTTSGRTANFTQGDLYSDADLDGTVNGSGVVSWIEFDNEIMPRRRFYFPSAGAAAISPTFGSQWDDTNDAVRLPLAKVGGLTASAQTVTVETVTTVPLDILTFQFICEEPLPGGPIDPRSFALITKANEDGSVSTGCYMQAVIRVVAPDGTERGVLYPGQTFTTTSAVSTDLNYDYSDSSGLVSPRTRKVEGTCAPVIAEAGDYLVVELGSRQCNASANLASQGLTSGSTDRGDLPITGINNTSVNRPWIEFTRSPLISYIPDPPTDLQTTPTSTTILLEWSPPEGC